MNEFELWSQQEDEFLKERTQNKQKLDWQSFSIEMAQALNLPRKSPQQCQDRYHQIISNDLLPKIDWSQEEEQKLIQKHKQMGNKWAAISQHLQGKNDNCVKNHFYSKLRKMIRKLNRIIQFYLKKVYKSIPNATIYKLVQASEERFKQKPNCSIQISLASQNVISKMLKLSLKQQLNEKNGVNFEKNNLDEYKELIQQIGRANKNYKKKSKKIKNSSIKAPIRTSKGHKTKKFENQIQSQDLEDQNISQEKQEVQKIKKSPKHPKKSKEELLIQPQDKQKQIQFGAGKNVQIKEGDEMQQLLKNIGLLHEAKRTRKMKNQESECGDNSMRSYSDLQNPSSEMSFFDDSYDCHRKEAKMFKHINKNFFGDNSSQIQGL